MDKLKKVFIFKSVIIILFIFILSCSSVGKRIIPDSEVLSRSEIIQKSIEKVENNYNDIILKKNVGIYKKGYRDWKVVLYSEENYYLLEVSEDGNIISIEKKEYSTNNKD